MSKNHTPEPVINSKQAETEVLFCGLDMFDVRVKVGTSYVQIRVHAPLPEGLDIPPASGEALMAMRKAVEPAYRQIAAGLIALHGLAVTKVGGVYDEAKARGMAQETIDNTCESVRVGLRRAAGKTTSALGLLLGLDAEENPAVKKAVLALVEGGHGEEVALAYLMANRPNKQQEG